IEPTPSGGRDGSLRSAMGWRASIGAGGFILTSNEVPLGKEHAMRTGGYVLALAVLPIGALASGWGPSSLGRAVDASVGADARADASVDAPVLPPAADAGPSGCNLLPVTLRDFHLSHPDFEHFTSDAVTPGLVKPDLGADGTPTYAPPGPTICTT